MFLIFMPHDEESIHFKIALTEEAAMTEVAELNRPGKDGYSRDYRYKEIQLDDWNAPEIDIDDRFALSSPIAELLQVEVGTIMKIKHITKKIYKMGCVDGKLCRERLSFLDLPDDLTSVNKDNFYERVQNLFYKGGYTKLQ